MVIIANKWKQLLVQRQFLLAPVPIKNSILSIAKSLNLQKTLDFLAGSQHSRRGDEWFNFLHLGVLLRLQSASRPGFGESRSQTTTGLLQTPPSSPEAPADGSHLLGLALKNLGRLAGGSDYRQT